MEKFEIKVAEGLKIPEEIETNISELDTFIKEKEDLANSLVVTNDMAQIEAADKDAAEIGKMEKALARFRIDFIKKWKAPVEHFETTCKGYEKRLNVAAANLRTKTAEVKQIAINKKRDDLREIFGKLIAEKIPENVRSSRHFDNFFALWTSPVTVGNWLNKSATIEKVRGHMESELDRVVSVITAVESTYTNDSEEKKEKARLVMLEDFDLSKIVTAVTAWEAEQRQLREAREKAEQRKREEAERIAREEANRKERMAREQAERKEREERAQAEREAAKLKTSPNIVVPERKPTSDTHENAPLFCLTLKFTTSAAKLRSLRSYIDANGITYEKIGEPVKL